MTTNKDRIHDILMNAVLEIKKENICSDAELHYLIEDLNEAQETIEEKELAPFIPKDDEDFFREREETERQERINAIENNREAYGYTN